jgi:hypothetical protein
MRSFIQSLCIGVTLILLGSAAAQSKNSVIGRSFKNDEIGLTYTLPESFVPQPENELPQDPKGREHFILVLWDNPRRTPVPRIAFVYDTKVAQVSPEDHALRYLHSAKAGEGYKVSEPRKMSMAGTTMWRMDYWRPDNSGQSYNSAIAIPFRDGRLLFIQMSARSQQELDSLVESLHALRFERH